MFLYCMRRMHQVAEPLPTKKKKRVKRQVLNTSTGMLEEESVEEEDDE
jgi:hypothetical protein